MKNLKKPKDVSKNQKNQQEIIKPISQVQFINLLIQNNIETNKKNFKNIYLQKIILSYKKRNFSKIYHTINYISKKLFKYIFIHNTIYNRGK